MPASLPIVLRRETWFDGLGKRLGINRGVEVGDRAFDALVYIETQAPDEAVLHLLGGERRRHAVVEILAIGFTRVEVTAARPRAVPLPRGVTATCTRPSAAAEDQPGQERGRAPLGAGSAGPARDAGDRAQEFDSGHCRRAVHGASSR